MDSFCGEFTASKIRRAIIIPADFRRTNYQRQIQRSAEGSGQYGLSDYIIPVNIKVELDKW